MDWWTNCSGHFQIEESATALSLQQRLSQDGWQDLMGETYCMSWVSIVCRARAGLSHIPAPAAMGALCLVDSRMRHSLLILFNFQCHS